MTPAQLLGPLKALDRKHAPEYRDVADNPGILVTRVRVANVGVRHASPSGPARAG